MLQHGRHRRHRAGAGARGGRPGPARLPARAAAGRHLAEAGGRVSPRPGALALVLHSHMPYVEGFDTWPFGEEWLWEAVASVYLPLLDVLDGAPVTLGLTPVLCDQLEAMPKGAGERCLRFLREMRRTVHEMDSQGLDESGEPRLAAEIRRAAADYENAADDLERRSLDPLAAFAALERVELWT